MEVQRKPASITVRISHVEFRRLLQSAWQADLKYHWLRQFRFLVSLASIDDGGVTLKLP